MAEKSKSLSEAETRLEKAQKRLQDGQKAMREQQAADHVEDRQQERVGIEQNPRTLNQ